MTTSDHHSTPRQWFLCFAACSVAALIAFVFVRSASHVWRYEPSTPAVAAAPPALPAPAVALVD